MELTAQQQRYALAFEVWRRRYEEDPNAFMTEAEVLAGGPVSYGEACALYFSKLLGSAS